MGYPDAAFPPLEGSRSPISVLGPWDLSVRDVRRVSVLWQPRPLTPSLDPFTRDTLSGFSAGTVASSLGEQERGLLGFTGERGDD